MKREYPGLSWINEAIYKILRSIGYFFSSIDSFFSSLAFNWMEKRCSCGKCQERAKKNGQSD